MYKYIITHGGLAHQDDFITTAIALGLSPNSIVYRRDPMPVELGESDVLVIDVGCDYNPEYNNYDHHQINIGSECTLTLFLRSHLDITEKWIDLVMIQDTSGVVAAAKKMQLTVQDYFAIKGPVDMALIAMFGIYDKLEPGYPLHSVMVDIGKRIFNESEFKYNRMVELKKRNVVVNKSGMSWIDLTGLERPTAYLYEAGVICNYKLIDSSRDKGVCNVLAGTRFGTPPLSNPEFSWIHKDGFIGALDPKVDPIEFMNSL